MLNNSTPGPLKQFGILICVALSVLFFLGYLNQVILASSVTITLFITIFRPSLLTWPYKGWMLLGHFIGLIVTPIVLGIIFIGVVFPTSLLTRLFRPQVIQTKYNESPDSYWEIRDNSNIDMRDQF